MENITNEDFDKLESLLKNKSFEELTWHEKQWVLTYIDETEYYSMCELYSAFDKVSDKTNHIEPLAATKNKLDKAFKSKANPNVFLNAYHLKVPFYQSLAVAVAFFMFGFFANIYKSKPIVVRDTVQVIKYIVQPVIANTIKPTIRRNNVAIKTPDKTNLENENMTPIKTNSEVNQAIEVINPEISMQHDIAMQNVNRVVNEKNGNSIEGDTVLQKMLVTVY